MTTWSRVKWSEAGQILDVLKVPDAAQAEAGGKAPEAYFDHLRKGGRQTDAIDFISQALPRLEVVAWAARTVRDAAPPAPNGKPEARALRAALLFVQDPTDQRRRAAFEAAEACDSHGPEALAALAAFFSGGSIAPPGSAPVQASRLSAGRFAAGAVKMAVFGGRDAAGLEAALGRCLDMGAELAREGLRGA